MTPVGLCRCGCGQRTSIATSDNPAMGYAKGEPRAYRSGHAMRGRYKYTDDELLAALREWFARHDGAPPAHPSRESYANRFGSWAAACERADVEQPRYWSKDRIVRALRAHYAAHGYPPTTSEWEKPSDMTRPATVTVTRTFGSWTAALSAAGMKPLTPQESLRRSRGDVCGRGHPRHGRGDCLVCRAARRRELGQRERMKTEEADRLAAEAVELIRQGLSVNAAATRVGMGKSALARRVHRDHPELVEWRRTISALEERVADALDDMGVSYRRQVALETPKSHCLIDFVIDGTLALEVNGTFWHADPRAFPTGPKYLSQRRVQESWIVKQAVVAAAGLTLRVAWEMDLDRDMRGTLQRALGRVAATA